MRRRRGPMVLAAVLALTTVSGVAVATYRHGAASSSRSPAVSCPPLLPQPTSPATPLTRAAATAAPSVVSLSARSNAQTDEGSGVVLRSDGLIVTNNHVVAAVAVNGGQITVTTADGRTSPAVVVGRKPSDDIAVIRTTRLGNLQPARLGSSSSLRVGQAVLAIGNALGEAGTVTSGIVSALGRTACVTSSGDADAGSDIFGTLPSLPGETDLDDLIQTDAPINPGNSGGALIDLQGRVVGITTLGLTTGGSSGSVGIGFAIRIERAYGDAQDLAAKAHV